MGSMHFVNVLFLYKETSSFLAPILFVSVALIGIRIFLYWWSFTFHWRRYRRRQPVSSRELGRIELPNLKIQITTRGSSGSTGVIMRGIRNALRLSLEDPDLYKDKLSVEVITESEKQAELINKKFLSSVLKVEAILMPSNYQTPNNTQLKARGMHYAVELRRKGWNKSRRKTFIVHYDEESVMTPTELRKLFDRLSSTSKQILEGPIYYPLEYMQASPLCRAMEANRPIGCYECRHVMESGMPLHLHGSNLVIEESLENEIGWDIGLLDGQAFISEDYVFGMNAFIKYGSGVFGWHGCVMLEQPPFSVRSAFKQRYRWIFGVLQGLAMAKNISDYKDLPLKTKLKINLGTRYRITTFALGSVVGGLSFMAMPLYVLHSLNYLIHHTGKPLPLPMSLLLFLVGAMWLGSIFVGCWYNIMNTRLDRWDQISQVASTIIVAPLAGFIESSAAFWAVLQWTFGKRNVNWIPTPKTKAADRAMSSNVMEKPVLA
jgi:hypothetical protein